MLHNTLQGQTKDDNKHIGMTLKLLPSKRAITTIWALKLLKPTSLFMPLHANNRMSTTVSFKIMFLK